MSKDTAPEVGTDLVSKDSSPDVRIDPVSKDGWLDVRTDAVSKDCSTDVSTDSVSKDTMRAFRTGSVRNLVASSITNCLPIADGGGLGSTADWTAPRAAHDQFLVLRKKFQIWVREWGLVSRLQKHVGVSSTASLLTGDETTAVRSALCSFLQQQGFGCDVSVPPRQPFLLSLWGALAQLTGDIDSALPTILEAGVPTGILQPVPCSGVWEPAVLTDADDAEDLPGLVRHLEPWGSAESDPTLVRELLQKDLDAGYLVPLPGGGEEALRRWGANVAAGKFGLVVAPGRKPRLIGDGSVSGVNGRCRIEEKVRLPGFESIQRFLSRVPRGTELVALSFDVRGAHKLVQVRPEEQGLSCFVLEGEWFHYTSCFFGCKWAAYWFSRVGAFLVRLLHRWIWLKHGLFLYVDDGLILLPAPIAPLVACSVIMFLVALGVPLSWEKLSLGTSMRWLGWGFNWADRVAWVPDDKRAKLLGFLVQLREPKRKVERRMLENCIGLLVWVCGGIYWLKPWLQPFYHLLFKPRCVFRTLSCAQFALMKSSLNTKLWLQSSLAVCDLQPGWRLHSIGNCLVDHLEAVPLACPRIKNNGIDCVFFDYKHKWVSTCHSSACTAKLFMTALSAQLDIPLQFSDVDMALCAADAFATEHTGGLGGWWAAPGAHPEKCAVHWFSLSVTPESFPSWFTESSKSLQSCISALEALAQLMLLVGRAQAHTAPKHCVLRFHQLCDNAGAAACSRKQLSMSKPMCFILQATGFYCSKFGVTLSSQHIDGTRNSWADALSRGDTSGFCPRLRCHFDLHDLLQAPWKDLDA